MKQEGQSANLRNKRSVNEAFVFSSCGFYIFRDIYTLAQYPFSAPLLNLPTLFIKRHAKTNIQNGASR